MNVRKMMISVALLVGLGAIAITHASVNNDHPTPVQRDPGPLYAPAPSARMSLWRLAQNQCIAHGQTCVVNGTPCCDATDSCAGTFPNTVCK